MGAREFNRNVDLIQAKLGAGEKARRTLLEQKPVMALAQMAAARGQLLRVADAGNTAGASISQIRAGIESLSTSSGAVRDLTRVIESGFAAVTSPETVLANIELLTGKLKRASPDNFWRSMALGAKSAVELSERGLKTYLDIARKAGLHGVAQIAEQLYKTSTEAAANYVAEQMIPAIRESGLQGRISQAVTSWLGPNTRAAETLADRGRRGLAGWSGVLGYVGTVLDQTRPKLAATLSDASRGLGLLSDRFRQVGGTLPGLLGMLGRSVGRRVGPAGEAGGEAMGVLMGRTIGKLIGGLAGAFGPLLTTIAPMRLLAEALAPVINALKNMLMPLLIPLQDMLLKVVAAMQPIVDALMPILQKLFVQLFTALKPIIDVVAQVVAVVLQGLSPVLDVLMEGVISVIKPLAELVGGVLTPLLPVIMSLVQAAFVPLSLVLKGMAPLLAAIAPLLGWLAEGIAFLLKPLQWLTGGMKSMMGGAEKAGKLIRMLSDAFTWLWEHSIIGWLVKKLVGGGTKGEKGAPTTAASGSAVAPVIVAPQPAGAPIPTMDVVGAGAVPSAPARSVNWGGTLASAMFPLPILFGKALKGPMDSLLRGSTKDSAEIVRAVRSVERAIVRAASLSEDGDAFDDDVRQIARFTIEA